MNLIDELDKFRNGLNYNKYLIAKNKAHAEYTPKDIETIKMIHFLVKEKGLKLDAAQALIRRNRDGVSKQFEVIERLKGIKAKLLTLNHYLGKVKE